MASQPELRLRRVISDGLANLNEERGGRYMSTVAAQLGVDRTTVYRWRRSTITASTDHCRQLATMYPDYFDEAELISMHAQAATNTALDDELTVGVQLRSTTVSTYREATRMLLRDPPLRRDRSCLHVGFHLDRVGADAVAHDPILDADAADEIVAFREAMIRRAAEGWEVRSVLAVGSAAKLELNERLVETLDGPNVQVRAYVASLPLSIAPLIIGNRDVMLAYDHRRWEKPGHSIVLRSKPIVDWATRYFEWLFGDAPYVLRAPYGPDAAGLARLRRDLQVEA